MPLLETPANPVPPGVELTSVRTRDGTLLRVASWPAGTPRERGTVVILQGRAEFIEKYFEVVGELRSRGFAVIAFDWRGQGGSDRALPDPRRGHVRHFRDFRLDCEAVWQSCLSGRRGPVHVLAHSMGGCIALTGVGEGWLAADRLVTTSPMVDLSLVRRPRAARALGRVLGRFGLASRLVPFGRAGSISTLPFAGNRLSGDPVRYARNAEVAAGLGSGAIGAPTVGWFLAAYEAMDRLATPGFAASVRTPTLVVAGGDDPVCSTPAIERFAGLLPIGTLVTVPGARHEILMERDPLRAAFWAAFDRFMADAEAGGGAVPSATAQPRRMSSTAA